MPATSSAWSRSSLTWPTSRCCAASLSDTTTFNFQLSVCSMPVFKSIGASAQASSSIQDRVRPLRGALAFAVLGSAACLRGNGRASCSGPNLAKMRHAPLRWLSVCSTVHAWGTGEAAVGTQHSWALRIMHAGVIMHAGLLGHHTYRPALAASPPFYQHSTVILRAVQLQQWHQGLPRSSIAAWLSTQRQSQVPRPLCNTSWALVASVAALLPLRGPAATAAAGTSYAAALDPQLSHTLLSPRQSPCRSCLVSPIIDECKSMMQEGRVQDCKTAVSSA